MDILNGAISTFKNGFAGGIGFAISAIFGVPIDEGEIRLFAISQILDAFKQLLPNANFGLVELLIALFGVLLVILSLISMKGSIEKTDDYAIGLMAYVFGLVSGALLIFAFIP
jgi:hypothetical protein